MPNNEYITTATDLETNLVNIHHPMDELGVVTGLDRLPEENVAAFRNRVYDVFVNKANASYLGLLNGINRHLGFTRERTLIIGLRAGITAESGPRLEVNSTNITIYSTWGINIDPVIELTIDIFNDTLSPQYDYHARYIIDIVNIINAYSSVFSAEVANTSYNYKLASSLIPISSIKLLRLEQIYNQRHKLTQDYIVPGSIVFNQSQLLTEKLFRGEDFDTDTPFFPPTNDEEYWVDYNQGYITLGFEDPRNLTATYLYNELPLTIYSMPIELYQFTDPEFQKVLYEAVLNAVSIYEKGLVVALGAKWINQILLESKHFWGGDVIRNTPLAANDRHTDIVDDLNLSNIDTTTFASSIKQGYNYTSTRETT